MPRGQVPGSPRGVRFNQPGGSPAPPADDPPMQPISSTMNDSFLSPFSPDYSMSAPNSPENVRRSNLTQEISPLDPAPSYAAAPSSGNGSKNNNHHQDDDDDDDDDEEEPVPLKSIKTRRATNAFVRPVTEASGGGDFDQVDPFSQPKPPSSPSPKRAMFADQTSDGGEGGAAVAQMPLKPPPTAMSPHHHGDQNVDRGWSQQPFALQPPAAAAFSPRSANAPFSPSPPAVIGNPWQQQQVRPQAAITSTSYIQHYDPQSSPSMVQPFSPKVTASGSIKSPALKPALRREQSYDTFRLEDSADSCERGNVRKTDSEDVRKAYGQGGVMKTLVGLYEQNSSPAPVSTTTMAGNLPMWTRKGSDADSDQVTLNGAISEKPTKSSSTMEENTKKNAGYQAPPTPRSLTSRRQSMAFTLGMDEEPMEEDDPRLTGMIRKSMQEKRDQQREQEFAHRRSSWSSETGDPSVPNRRPQQPLRRPSRRFSIASLGMVDEDEKDPDGFNKMAERRKSMDRRKSATTITYNVAHVMHRQKFVLKLARALMLFGAPSHRIESQLNATANVLELDAQFIHFPGIVIASFGDVDKHTSETHFVKSSSALTLGALFHVHTIYRQVVHDEIGVEEGTEELNLLLQAKPCYGKCTRIFLAAATCWIIAPLSFGGSFLDAFVAAAYGALLTFLNLHVARKNAMYSNVFEISVAIIISFISRGLSTTGLFCYQAIASSGVILVLPGYIILCGSLELASKNMIAGSVRMVYAIIYSLFLGFGIAIGSDVYFLVDPESRKSMYVPLNTATEVEGSFFLQNATLPEWSGKFSFSNGTSNALQSGSINCERKPEWPWYKQSITPWANFAFVPAFSLLLAMNNLQPWKSKEIIVMIIIACVGYTANMAANHWIFNRSDVVSAIGSFVIGVLGNLYSRIFRGTAFTAMAVAVLFLVPSGMAMAGGLAMTYKGSDGDLYSNGLNIGLRMVTVALGITTGLLMSGFVVYSFGRRKGAALFAF